jgi:ketosteroid isomerase-like protein
MDDVVTLRLPLAALVLALASACATLPPRTAPDADAAGLAMRERSLLEALSARDAAATSRHFAEDAVLHVAGMPPVSGRAAIHDFYHTVFRFLRASEPESETLRVSSGGDMGYGTGRVTNVFDGEGGPVRHVGKYILVWERREGEWLVTAYGISSDRAEPVREPSR